MPKKEQEIQPIDASVDDVVSAMVNTTAQKKSSTKRVSTKESGILEVQGVEIHVFEREDEDYISLTDMCRAKDGDFFISDWLRNRNTVEFLGVWESVNNPNFNYGEFATIRSQVGLNSYKISVKEWNEKTNAIGLIAKTGRYGGTYAHKDIAFEFGMWISPEFKVYLIKEFQRLKEQESKSNNLEWNIRRTLVKAQYRTHTDAVKAHLIPPELPKHKQGWIYASEADILNIVMFGKTAKDWKIENPKMDGNPRDYASIEQLVVLASLESQNALLIEQGVDKTKRMELLSDLAQRQMKSLLTNPSVKKLSDKPLLEN